MLNRNFAKFIRRHLCAASGAAMVIYARLNGASNGIDMIFYCLTIAMCLYGAMWAIDRVAGIVSPIIIDVRDFETERDAKCFTIHTQSNSIIELDIINDGIIGQMHFDKDIKFMSQSYEYCYLQYSDDGFYKLDANLAYILVRKLRADDNKLTVSGLGYQV